MLKSAAETGSTMSHPDTGPPWAMIVNWPVYGPPGDAWVSVTLPGATPSVPGDGGGDGGGDGECELRLGVGRGLPVGCDPDPGPGPDPGPEPGCAVGDGCELPPTDPPLSLPEW